MKTIDKEGFGLGIVALICVGLSIIGGASAQSPMTPGPFPTTTNNASGAIGVTNTFQSIWAAATEPRTRAGCTVQNTGTNPMYVYVGAIADATVAKSYKLTTGLIFTCNVGNTVAQDQISITGTATETFYAAQN